MKKLFFFTITLCKLKEKTGLFFLKKARIVYFFLKKAILTEFTPYKDYILFFGKVFTEKLVKVRNAKIIWTKWFFSLINSVYIIKFLLNNRSVNAKAVNLTPFS